MPPIDANIEARAIPDESVAPSDSEESVEHQSVILSDAADEDETAMLNDAASEDETAVLSDAAAVDETAMIGDVPVPFPADVRQKPQAPAQPQRLRATDMRATDNGDQAGTPMNHPLVHDLLINPTRWRLWPAIAVLRWVQRRMQPSSARIVFRSQPSLSFATSEIHDVAIRQDRIELILNAAGLASAGSPLPTSDIARIIADKRAGGALSDWLDGPADRFIHVLESVLVQNAPAYSLMTGDKIEAFMIASRIVGRSTPLSAASGGRLYGSPGLEPEGAIGLAGLFLGPTSAAGLKGVVEAFTGLPTRIEEFTGATVPTARPARLGRPFGLMLGAACQLPAAGVEIHLQGGADPAAKDWARDPERRASLHILATAYIGSPTPAASRFLWLDGDIVPPAALDGGAALGGLSVLGKTSDAVRLPLAAE